MYQIVSVVIIKDGCRGIRQGVSGLLPEVTQIDSNTGKQLLITVK